MSQEAVTVEELKQRMVAASKPQSAPAADQPSKPRMSAERLAEIDKFHADMAALNTPVVEEKIDLGPLPDAAKKKKVPAELTGVPRTLYEDDRLRKIIEGKCQPLDLGDLIMTGRVTQVVPVLPGKLTITYQSLLGKESFWLEKTVAQQGLGDILARNAWSIYARLVMAVSAINGKQFEPHVDDAGNVDQEAYEKKYAQVMRMSERVLEVMIANLSWFDTRVNKLIENDFEALKNG